MRRAISNPSSVKDIDWSDKTIEVTETAEEAVVDKTAHITEEVVIRRQGSDRTQTVHDKVRRQQVEVDHVPVGAGTKKSA
jgi:stress response protein YsnF